MKKPILSHPTQRTPFVNELEKYIDYLEAKDKKAIENIDLMYVDYCKGRCSKNDLIIGIKRVIKK